MKLKLLIIGILMILSCKEENKSFLEKRIKNQITHVNKSKEFSDMAIKVMNLTEEGIVDQNKIDSFKELIKKALAEAKKVDTKLLNDIKKGYGTNFSEKYIKGLEMQLESYENGNAKNMVKGQILYEEYVEWISKNLKQPPAGARL